MRSQIWIWFVGGLAVLMIGGYVLVTKVGSVPAPIMQAGMQNMPASREGINMSNPLLAASISDTGHWFPLGCFAEIYVVDHPSYGDYDFRNSCVSDVIQRVKENTGVTITKAQVLSPEALAHFRKIFTEAYGAKETSKWRQ